MPACTHVTRKSERFALRHTRLQSPHLLPEIRLYLADEIEPLWRHVQADSGQPDAPPPYWAFAWVGGQAVARYVLDNAEEIRGRSVLDLATGSGICAIAAAKADAKQVLAADIDRYAGLAVAANAEVNEVSIAFTDRDLLEREPPRVDIILAGDVFYERELARRAQPWLEAASARGVQVLIGDPGRGYLQPDGLMPIAEYEVGTTREVESSDAKWTRVYTLAGS
jgi:predicted nicotinamide N-methyase